MSFEMVGIFLVVISIVSLTVLVNFIHFQLREIAAELSSLSAAIRAGVGNLTEQKNTLFRIANYLTGDKVVKFREEENTIRVYRGRASDKEYFDRIKQNLEYRKLTF